MSKEVRKEGSKEVSKQVSKQVSVVSCKFKIIYARMHACVYCIILLVCFYVYMCVGAHARMYKCACMNALCTYMYVCVHACMNLCIHVCIDTRTLFNQSSFCCFKP